MTARTGPGPRPSWRDELCFLFTLHDSPWRWSVGLQAGLAVGVPMVALTLAGHEAEGLIASMGAFTALYYATMRRVDRVKVLPLVGAGFVLAATIGVLASSHVWWTVLALNVVAVVATLLAFAIRLGPPGPMMFVLVAGVTNGMAAAGAGGPDRWRLPALVAIGALGAYLVVIAPLALPAQRRREGATAPLTRLMQLTRLDRVSAIIAARVITAVAIASVLAVPLGIGHAYWLIMVAGVVLQVRHSLRFTTTRGAHRVLGTVAGVAVFGLFALLGPSGLALAVLIAVLQAVVEIVIGRHYGLGLVFITPLSLLIATSSHASSTVSVVSDRVVDTLLGALLALIVLGISEWHLAHRRRHRTA
jgi:hypothetical protein